MDALGVSLRKHCLCWVWDKVLLKDSRAQDRTYLDPQVLFKVWSLHEHRNHDLHTHT